MGHDHVLCMPRLLVLWKLRLTQEIWQVQREKPHGTVHGVPHVCEDVTELYTV